MVRVKLSRPLEHGGATLTEIALDLDKLTGGDFCVAEREALMENANIPPADPRLSPGVQAQLAERASGIPVAVLRGLPLRDYVEVVVAVRDFLLAGG